MSSSMTGSLLLHVGFVDVRSFRSRNIRRILAGLLPSHGPTSQGKLDEAKGDYQQALDGYNTKKLYERNPDVVATRELKHRPTGWKSKHNHPGRAPLI